MFGLPCRTKRAVTIADTHASASSAQPPHLLSSPPPHPTQSNCVFATNQYTLSESGRLWGWLRHHGRPVSITNWRRRRRKRADVHSRRRTTRLHSKCQASADNTQKEPQTARSDARSPTGSCRKELQRSTEVFNNNPSSTVCLDRATQRQRKITSKKIHCMKPTAAKTLRKPLGHCIMTPCLSTSVRNPCSLQGATRTI